MKNKKALIVVDVQNDFCPGGSLAVKEGDQIVKPINDLMNSGEYDLIVATQDWHPLSHKSFASNNPGKKVGELGELGGQVQVMWPDHCIQNSEGAKMHPQLNLEKIDKVFPKGTNQEVDSYSGFFDNDKKSSTGLSDYLKKEGIKEVDVVGLALDYCVKATALDAKQEGFKTKVLVDYTRAVNLNPNDGMDAQKELLKSGVALGIKTKK